MQAVILLSLLEGLKYPTCFIKLFNMEGGGKPYFMYFTTDKYDPFIENP